MKEKVINKMSIKNYSFFKDFSWYFLGSIIPLLIGFIKTPVFTRHFNKEAYGYLGLVTITFSYLGMILFSWIGSCVWRYYNKYEANNSLKTLYSNLFFLYLIAFVVLFIATTFWYFLAEYQLVKQLIYFSFFQLILNQLFLFYMVIIRLKGNAVFYTVFQSIRALLSLIAALILVFVYQVNISALISSLVLIDALAIIFLAIFNPADVHFNYKFINKQNLKELLHYGSAGLIINIGFLVIASSDRYIIALLSSLESVGIYDQVYKISQLSLVALVTIYFNTVNPSLLKVLETNFENSIQQIKNHIAVFIFLGLPIVTYLSLFSKDLAYIFLGPEFRPGYSMMPFIFIAAYLHGISNFFELRLKFSNKLKRLGLIVVIMAILNIILNYIFVSAFGYKLAAVTTTITYVFLIAAFHFYDRNILAISKENTIKLFKILIVLALQIMAYYVVVQLYEINIFLKIFIGLLFVFTYIIIFKNLLLETIRSIYN